MPVPRSLSAAVLLSLALAVPVAAPAIATDEQAAAAGARLKVRAEHVESDMGMVRVEVYADAESFRRPTLAAPLREQSVPAAPGRVTAVFDDLPPGRYAVRVLHDENGNGKLDRAFGLFTLEGEGVSNAEDPRRAPFDIAAFDVPDAGAVVVHVPLRY